jgi:uncharacterized protein (UPF0147 family)
MSLDELRNTPPWEWPDDADETILKVLRDAGAGESDRILAAELAGDYVVINEKLAAELHSILTDEEESEEIRCKAAISFGPALENADMMGFDDPDDILLSEKTCEKIQKTLRKIHMDADVPEILRRRVLEASVRAPMDWHRKAVRAAWDSGNEQWKLTAVFCMEYIGGFEKQIKEALKSENLDIEYHAVRAAGNWEIAGAWNHVVKLIESEKTDKDLLLAAIEAAAFIRPEDARKLLFPLLASEDPDIVDAVNEALAMAEEDFDDEYYNDDPF